MVNNTTALKNRWVSFDTWTFIPFLLSLILFGPIICLFITASGDSEGLWQHLYQTVLLKYIVNTLLLMIGVSISVLILGVGAAWLVSRRGVCDEEVASPLLITETTFIDNRLN